MYIRYDIKVEYKYIGDNIKNLPKLHHEIPLRKLTCPPQKGLFE